MCDSLEEVYEKKWNIATRKEYFIDNYKLETEIHQDNTINAVPKYNNMPHRSTRRVNIDARCS